MATGLSDAESPFVDNWYKADKLEDVIADYRIVCQMDDSDIKYAAIGKLQARAAALHGKIRMPYLGTPKAPKVELDTAAINAGIKAK